MSDLFEHYKNINKCIMCEGKKSNHQLHHQTGFYNSSFCNYNFESLDDNEEESTYLNFPYEFFVNTDNDLQFSFYMNKEIYILRYTDSKLKLEEFPSYKTLCIFQLDNLELIKFNNRDEVISLTTKLLDNLCLD